MFTQQAEHVVAINPDNNAVFDTPSCLFIGTAGATGVVKVKTVGGEDVVITVGTSMPIILPILCVKVYATGTDCSNILRLY